MSAPTTDILSPDNATTADGPLMAVVSGSSGSPPFFQDESLTLWNRDCREMWHELAGAPAILLDPPFDKWDCVPWWPNATKVCFTNWQNRAAVEAKFGVPRCEIIWHFRDGRWVSHEMPRITHEAILIYGPTGSAYVGEVNEDMTPKKKGRGCVGRDKMPERIYVPRERKALNSVLEYPRNVSGALGCWGKPVKLMTDILAWVGAPLVADAYAGSCSAALAARTLGIKIIACEIDKQTCESAARRLAQIEIAI
tara:strand:- start:108 stop:866 length:759 start_codon:yes stop_codon:yes gene_type:complete